MANLSSGRQVELKMTRQSLSATHRPFSQRGFANEAQSTLAPPQQTSLAEASISAALEALTG